MRGKLVVILMLASGALMLAFSLWFVNNHSPADERFDMRRDPLAADTPGPFILKERVGEFDRDSLNVDTLDNVEAGQVRHGAATYRDYQDKQIVLDVRQIEGTTPTLDALFADFDARAGNRDGRASDNAFRFHPEARVPYGYGVYSGPTYTYYEFTWINNGWILRAWTRDAGSESLLRFVNSYSY